MGKIIVGAAIVLMGALGLFVWMRRGVERAAAPAAGAPATRGGATAAGGATATGGEPATGGAAATTDAALPPGTMIGPNGVVFHNPAITGKPPTPAPRLNVSKPSPPRATKPNPEAVRQKLRGAE